MPLPQQRDLNPETMLRFAFPNATDEAIWTYLDDIRHPLWKRENCWVQHIPDWIKRNWKYLSMNERVITYTFCCAIENRIRETSSDLQIAGEMYDDFISTRC